MLKFNSELRAEARDSLKGKWGRGAVISLIYTAIIAAGGLSAHLSLLFSLFVGVILGYGLQITFLQSFRRMPLNIVNLFLGFQNYLVVLGTMLLMILYSFLWTLLLIIPGIIKSYSYAMTPYLRYEYPELGAEELICKSMEMMKGRKMKLFLLDLSFIGWGVLSILTLGIGLLWLFPYMYSARAAFYEDIRTETV
ncbi:MAG: DUF975 family protein [Prevotellaceae bacterium]|jgi:uncharacterized membrane protein|nr:DUF975 family protein [Prevotellaceae bacterium]